MIQMNHPIKWILVVFLGIFLNSTLTEYGWSAPHSKKNKRTIGTQRVIGKQVESVYPKVPLCIPMCPKAKKTHHLSALISVSCAHCFECLRDILPKIIEQYSEQVSITLFINPMNFLDIPMAKVVLSREVGNANEKMKMLRFLMETQSDWMAPYLNKVSEAQKVLDYDNFLSGYTNKNEKNLITAYVGTNDPFMYLKIFLLKSELPLSASTLEKKICKISRMLSTITDGSILHAVQNFKKPSGEEITFAPAFFWDGEYLDISGTSELLDIVSQKLTKSTILLK